MRVAFLIQAHNNYQHLQKLISALQHEDCYFFIHIDKKSSMPLLKGNNINFIKKRIDIHWSGFSQVQATLEQLKIAMKENFDYYCPVSGADYPIKPIKWLFEKLAGCNEFIEIQKIGEDPFAPESRYKFFYFTDYFERRNTTLFKTRFFLWLQIFLRKCRIKKKIPFQLYTGACWFALSAKCMNYVMDKLNNDKRYIKFYKTGFFADESIFATIVGNSNFIKNVQPNLTYADWSTNPGPAIISKRHLETLRSQHTKFFARKFTDQSINVVAQIDHQLRHV